ncbi:MAG: hypothetical protein Q9201_004335 [Fulgogasparrea decipioides]
MTLRDLLKKREKISKDAGRGKAPTEEDAPPTQFTFMRSDTNTQEVISPPSFAEDYNPHLTKDTNPDKKRFSRFRKASNASTTSTVSSQGEKRLSARLHLGSHSRSSSAGSVNVPRDLPAIGDLVAENEEKEAQWEKRATILAQENVIAKQVRSREGSVAESSLGGRPAISRSISDAQGDVREDDTSPET